MGNPIRLVALALPLLAAAPAAVAAPTPAPPPSYSPAVPSDGRPQLGLEANLGFFQNSEVSGDDSGLLTTGLAFLRVYF